MEQIDIESLIAKPGKKVNLRKDFDPGYKGNIGKAEATELLEAFREKLADYQERLYAEDSHGLLVIFQAMDAAGKDGTIKHVMSGVNPQGCQVFSFKSPSSEELDHDFLWRCHKSLPERGRIGIFNRSYYEEVLVVRVHPDFLDMQNLPADLKNKGVWKRRFEQINNFEKYLTENGIEVVKFFLNVSKEEQKRRFLARIERPEKNWKFSMADIQERAFWDDYQSAYEEVFQHTSTDWAPWHVIPADHKWFTHLAVCKVLLDRLKKIDPRFPIVSEERKQALAQVRARLEEE